MMGIRGYNGTGEWKAVSRFCAVSVGSSGLPVVAPFSDCGSGPDPSYRKIEVLAKVGAAVETWLMSFLSAITGSLYFLSVRNVRRRSSSCSPPSCGVVASIPSRDMSVPKICVMVGGNATFRESPTRLEVGFHTTGVDRGFDLAGGGVSVSAAFPSLTIILSVSRAECICKPRDQLGVLHRKFHNGEFPMEHPHWLR